MSKNSMNVIEEGGLVPVQERYPHDVSGSHDYNQGDLMYRDATSQQVWPLDTDAHAATFVGVAAKPGFIAPYTQTQLAGGPAMGKVYDLNALIQRDCIVGLFGHTGETYYDGNSVYLDASADPQTICNTAGNAQGGAGAHPVGVVKLPDGVTSQAYAAGVRVPVRIIAQFPIAQ